MDTGKFIHKSVLLNECINSLNIKADGVYVDGTAGGAGHSLEIAKRLSTGRLIAVDRDPDAVLTATNRLRDYNACVVKDNFQNISVILDRLNIEKIDGLLLDLGVSSYQLDNSERGFSFHKDAPLDMRMSKDGISAADIVNNATQEELNRILKNYGEEKFSFNIAKNIVKARENRKIETTFQLSEIISNSIPAKFKRDGHPARKAFQALRIAVNGELEAIESVLDDAFERLNSDGRLAVITFHSLEDRIVKQKFKEFCTGCTCPPDFPVCVCGKKPRGYLLTKKPILPSNEEISENQRSRSAKLRVIVKI